MSDAKKQIKIENLHEVFEILPDDEIYVFQRNYGTYTKLEVPVTVLSTYFHAEGAAERLRAKTAELVKLSGEFINWLQSTYPDENYISANYTTTKEFDEIYAPLKAESELASYLDDYATKDYGRLKLAEDKTLYEQTRADYLRIWGDSIVNQVDMRFEPEDGLSTD